MRLKSQLVLTKACVQQSVTLDCYVKKEIIEFKGATKTGGYCLTDEVKDKLK
jgi:hypothetical protein